jgi:hypothetical protein
MRQPAGHTSERAPSVPASQRRRFERARGAVDERHRIAEQRLAAAWRRALISAWLRSLSRAR